ncbi:MAG: response regulator transcription factor [Aminobacterium sp.]|nr:response regulator transcription factor [Aminobacterium sp.]MDD3426839.1 response regulator transcription factor [Aminobacterium sp.]MDD3708210.1 response regulator transcription factor [Aminobacterium sp.]MDD4229546.1 response regulator transcription factor [Aminobacterium sp.]MDD4552419.1 response regulator transcription factor [Aminobacterium sp.]
MNDSRILIVDDEKGIQDIVSQALKRRGYETLVASDGDTALDLAFASRPDLIILDLMLPRMDGWEVCRRLKSNKETATIPIIMLTARRGEMDVVEGLELGADDYMKKPFSLAELVARVGVLLRRNQTSQEMRQITNKELALDLESQSVTLREKTLDLSPTEFRILELLTRRFGKTVSRDELLGKIWNLYGGDTRTLDVHISRLRRKIDDEKRPVLEIQTLRSRGYRIVWED